MTPRVGPFLTPGAWLAWFIKRTTICCYLQNMKALGLVVSEKKIFFMFFPWRPRGGACMDPRGMVGRIYEVDHYTMLHTKYESSGPCDFGEEDFLMFYPWPPGAGPVWTPGAPLAGFIIRTTIHCYTQNMKALGLVVSDKKIFKVFPMMPPGLDPYGPQGHGWQDL